MATNLLISFPQQAKGSKYVYSSTQTKSESPNGLYQLEHYNTLYGPRYAHWRTDAVTYPSQTEGNIWYDAGVGGTLAVNHFIVSRADLIAAASADLRLLLRYSDDDSSYGSFHNSGAGFSGSLVGPKSQDYVYSQSSSETHRYWDFRIDSVAAAVATLECSKVYFGEWFDFGDEPHRDYRISRVPIKDSMFETHTGVTYSEGLDDSIYEFEFEWKGITDAKVNSLTSNILRYPSDGVFLYTSSNHEILDSKRLVHCVIEEHRIEKIEGVTDYNNVFIKFREMIG